MAGESRKRKLDADIASPSASDVSGTLTCPVCLDIFTSPKILSCAHTFCLKCLEGVAHRYGGGVFPCPSCRDFIRIPRGGVSAFKTNFYIKPEVLEKARKGLFCSVHPKRDLELFCVDCDVSKLISSGGRCPPEPPNGALPLCPAGASASPGPLPFRFFYFSQ
ncbi:tripartite motif-containing protein 59-like [Littorina saxatilis]|uniref:tripartite motif-containing protein 59-like n=1 Tax=Littorina saxatilis TaxID=31220 RepID=UPI0038B5514A